MKKKVLLIFTIIILYEQPFFVNSFYQTINKNNVMPFPDFKLPLYASKI